MIFSLNKHKKTYLKHYSKPDFLIKNTQLTFDILAEHTIVTSHLKCSYNDHITKYKEIKLNGDNLELIEVKLNNKVISPRFYKRTDRFLIIPVTEKEFSLTIQTKIYPKKNFSGEGLYQSGSILCTQNEAEGFRKITYYLDRPDVMSIFKTTIKADKKTYPYLLSNGNKVAEKSFKNGRHEVKWEDPFPKPCYLFALVAGDLAKVTSHFKTKSKRNVDIEFFVDHGNEDRCDHAIESLKKAMKWDEDIYDLEYDLDLYMVVAVDSFNMGAMENKGLNIFNSSYVLANTKTATDNDFLGIESVIAHEYFHNYTGNRVTCRDWFQLTLKEGLTVFRDQEFSADMQSSAVQRIQDVKILRDHQFIEDAGPMAHPIKPQSYKQIDNFYTSTIYNKGAEVIRMMQTIVGKKHFIEGVKHYLEKHDGQAATTEDFVTAIEEISGQDLSQFKSWYLQAATPEVNVTSYYNKADKTLKLSFEQFCRPTAEKKKKEPYIIPLRCELYDDKNNPIKSTLIGESKANTENIITITQKKSDFIFTDVKTKPVFSLLADFSAPIKLNYDYSQDEILRLISHDKNAFNRYDFAQQLATKTLLSFADDYKKNNNAIPDETTFNAYAQFLENIDDPAFVSLALTFPTEGTLLDKSKTYDFDLIHTVRECFIKEFSNIHREILFKTYELLEKDTDPNKIDSTTIGKRSLKNKCLFYLSYCDEEFLDLAYNQFSNAQNMTDESAALNCLIHYENKYSQKASDQFYRKWKRDTLIMDKWLAILASRKASNLLDSIITLEKDPVFDSRNPNKIRSLYGAYTRNLVHFHDQSGEGYSFISKRISDIDSFNPSMASRLALCFKSVSRVNSDRRKLITSELKGIKKRKNCSSHLTEVCNTILKSV